MSGLTEQGKRQLIIDEGKKNKLYKCTADKWTIGIGHNIEDNGVSEAVIDLMFCEDIQVVVNQLMKFAWFTVCNEARKDVLINMVFNLGINRLLNFKNMIAALERKDYEIASIEMLQSKWSSQVGDRAKRLSQLMSDGTY